MEDFLVQKRVREKSAESLMAAFSDLEQPIEETTPVLEEIPMYRADPHAFLPQNAEVLTGTEKDLEELHCTIEEELKEAAKLQKQIDLVEGKVRRNNALIAKNLEEIKRNIADVSYQKKNRDYWFDREQRVLSDYNSVAGSYREMDWAWLIKKYGLKDTMGSLIDYRSPCVADLCRKSAGELMMEYKEAGLKHEKILEGRLADNARIESTNQKLNKTNEELNSHIANAQFGELEPIQDGALLLRELSLKLRFLSGQERGVTFGELRAWAEDYLDQFLRKYPLIPHRSVSAFRRIASIPLPAQNS